HAILSQEKSFGHLDLLKKTKLEENAGYRYFQNGDEIEVTPEQRLMLNDGWMHIKTLKALGFPTSGVKMGNATLQYRVHSGEQYIVKVNNKRSIHKTFEDAVDYLRNELEKPTNRETVFNIYQNRKSGKYFIGKPIQGKEPIQLSEWFDTQKEVTDYFRDNRDEVQAKWDAMSLKPEERRSENRERQGRDWRNGKDVTPDQFQSEFGFRGTEFGNWVNQQERQYALNNAYDALMDLSSVLDISPRALSLNGELGMAFGARGTGNAGGSTASAHYESAKVVINLTKKSGAGSLAHEWWHALDNYFARIGNKSLDFATDGTKGLDTNVREEMKQAFNDIVDAIKKSGLPKRSGELDKTRSKPYWATNVEMSARAFENYVIKSLSEKGDSNDYLANFKELSDWATVGSFEVDSYPYPTKEESHDINEKFQQFFDTIQEKVNEETGNTILFRKVDEAGYYSTVEDALRELAPNGMTLFRKKDSEAREAYAMREWNRAKTAISKLSEKMGLDVEIMETTEGLPKGKAESKGWYDVNSKKITIVMPNHTSSWDAQATLLHEAVGHHGLRELFGEHFDTFLDNVYNNAEEGIKDQIDRIGGDTRRATDEYLSRLAEDQEILQTDRLRGFFNEVRKFFFEMLAKLGFNPGFKLSENELKYILWRSYQNLSEPGRYRSIAGHAKDVAMQHSLKVGNYAEKEVSANVAEDPGFIAKKLNQAVFDQLSNDFENATTLEEKHTAAETIIRGIERVIGNDYSNVAQTHEDLIRLSPKLTEEQKRTIRSGRVVGYFDGRSIHLDVESIDTAHELIAAWFHENGHRIIREEFSGTEFEDLYESIKNIDDLNYFLPDFYINETAAVKGEEMITHGVGIVVSNNSLEDVVNNNIDYGNMPAQLRKFVETIFNKLHDEQIQKREHNTRQIWESGLSTDAGQGDGRRIPGDTETSRRTFGEDRQGNDIERRSRKDSNVSDRRINIEGTVGDLQVIKDRSISNGTFMKAPNGKHTNLTERQWLQVRTKEFMAWFGDWMNDPASASKIVDENGEPLVVYHGTTVDFTEFKDVVKKGMITTVANGYGYFFTPSKDIASK
ncbi:MAG: LPD5 domain-containing protein, partial [Proteiniphilum sp.]|nr:LPD5 domain-containing protein [Proteiniphilum sp.]